MEGFDLLLKYRQNLLFLPLLILPLIPVYAWYYLAVTTWMAIIAFFISTIWIVALYQQIEKKRFTQIDPIVSAVQSMSSEMIFALLDDKGHFIQVSEAFCNVIGYKEDELLSRHCSVLYDEKCTNNKRLPTDIVKNKSCSQIQVCSRDSKGKLHWFTAMIYKLSKGGNSSYLAICQEITGTPLLKERQEMLERQSKYAAMGEMIGMIAHQWRQPLSTIAAIAGNIKISIDLDTSTDEKTFEAMTKVNQYALHLSETINDFRNFFSPQKDIVDISTRELALGALKFTTHIGQSYGINIKNECNLKETVSVPKNEMLQVLINLIKNSQDVLVGRDIVNRQITIRDFLINNTIVLEVADNGGGIDASIADKIFDPYFTTKKSDGTGLGLYMSRRIIEEHVNGTLQAYNSDEGAVFSIAIPMKETIELVNKE